MKVNTDNIEAVLCADAAVDLNRLWRPFMDKKTGEVDLLEWAWSITHRVANPDEGDVWVFAACTDWDGAGRTMVLRLADLLVERAKYRVAHYRPRYVTDIQKGTAQEVISWLEHYRSTLSKLKDGHGAARVLIAMRRIARTLASDLSREGETYMQHSDLCVVVSPTQETTAMLYVAAPEASVESAP